MQTFSIVGNIVLEFYTPVFVLSLCAWIPLKCRSFSFFFCFLFLSFYFAGIAKQFCNIFNEFIQRFNVCHLWSLEKVLRKSTSLFIHVCMLSSEIECELFRLLGIIFARTENGCRYMLSVRVCVGACLKFNSNMIYSKRLWMKESWMACERHVNIRHQYAERCFVFV